MTFCFKGFLVLLVFALISYIELQYYTVYVRPIYAVTENYLGVFINISINALLTFMLIWSLIQTYVSNPGYVGDYVSSKPSEQRPTSVIYEVFLKSSNRKVDEETPL